MSNINALKILDDGTLEHAMVGRVDNGTYADNIGRLLTDSGRTDTILGWGQMDGTVRILVDDLDRDAYYVR